MRVCGVLVDLTILEKKNCFGLMFETERGFGGGGIPMIVWENRGSYAINKGINNNKICRQNRENSINESMA